MVYLFNRLSTFWISLLAYNAASLAFLTFLCSFFSFLYFWVSSIALSYLEWYSAFVLEMDPTSERWLISSGPYSDWISLFCSSWLSEIVLSFDPSWIFYIFSKLVFISFYKVYNHSMLHFWNTFFRASSSWLSKSLSIARLF